MTDGPTITLYACAGFHFVTAVFLMLNAEQAALDTYGQDSSRVQFVAAETCRAMGAMIFGLAACLFAAARFGDARGRAAALTAYSVFNVVDLVVIVFQAAFRDTMGPPVLLAIHHLLLTTSAGYFAVRDRALLSKSSKSKSA
jgi:hypothetical protein